MNTPQETYALLWIQSQNAFHVEPIDVMLQSNRRASAEGRRMDYVPILFGSAEDCREAGRSMRKALASRNQTC